MKNKKRSQNYYLDVDIIEWLAETGKDDNRSASNFLNDLLRKTKDANEK